MIFYRVVKTEKRNKNTFENYRIIEADKEQLNYFFDEHIFEKSIPLFKDKKDNIFGFTAVDENKNVVGFITACPDEMGTPINGMQWLVPYIFVEAEHQRKGIGSALLNELLKSARKENIIQLGLIRLDENTISFLYNNDFDVCVWYIMGGDVKPVSAAIRV